MEFTLQAPIMYFIMASAATQQHNIVVILADASGNANLGYRSKAPLEKLNARAK
jgi:hypothetical protein